MKYTLLIVEDDLDTSEMLRVYFEAQGYRVVTAGGGQEALEKTDKYSPDIILLDIMMPGLDGYAVTRKLKNNPDTRDIPVILITALDGTDDKVKGLEAGADEF